MNKSPSKNAVSIFLSILAGLVGAFATFFGLILIFFSVGLFGWGDGGAPGELERLEKTTNITLVISILAAFAVGFFTIAKMNKPKKQEKNSSPSDNL